MKIRPAIWFLFFFLLSGYFSLVRLDNTVLWDDEAYVGIIARNYVEQGFFTGWTGRNLYGYANGTVLNADLRPINPPLDVLLMAASFRIFGVSTWAARIPFALAALMALAVFGLIMRREWKENIAAQIYAFGFLALSVVFLLNARTGRYYALALLFSLGCYFFYGSTFASKRARDFGGLAICAAGLFYSNYLLCVVFLLSLSVLHLSLRAREWDKAQWRLCGLAVVVFLLLTVPYAWMFRIWHRPDLDASTLSWPVSRAILLTFNFSGLSAGNYLPLVIVVGVFLLLGVPRLRIQFASMLAPLRAWLLIVLAYLFFQAMLSAMPVHGTIGMAELRYFIPILPFCAGLVGLCLSALHFYSRGAAATVFACLLACNVLTVNPLINEFRWLLPAYVWEIHHPYPTSGSETIKFLRESAKQDDVVRVVRHHHNYPLVFYMDDKLRFGALLDAKTPLPKAKVESLGAFLKVEETFPDWLIFFGHTENWRQWLMYLSRPTLKNGQWVSHPYRLEKTLAIYFDQTQRPEIPWHSFGPVRDYDAAKEVVFIYRRSTPVRAAPAPNRVFTLPNVKG